MRELNNNGKSEVNEEFLGNLVKGDNPFSFVEQDGEVTIALGEELKEIDDLDELESYKKKVKGKVNNIFFQTPFSLVNKIGQGVAHGNEPILAFAVKNEIKITKDEVLSFLSDGIIKYGEIIPDISNEDFEKMVEEVIKRIQTGDICQCIISRKFETILKNFSPTILLTIFKRLLGINGSYMTFLSYFGKQKNGTKKVYAGASPEVNIKVKKDEVIKGPIAGTIAKKEFDNFYKRLIEFLENSKEENELSMVTDEELKMLMKVSEGGEITGPILREIVAVIHTEMLFKGKRKEGMTALQAFSYTYPAPTLSGSPLKSALSTIKEMEEGTREYYGGAVGFLNVQDDTLDTGISIRMGEIDLTNNGNTTLSVRAGAGVVSDSTPEGETQETINKANGFVGILSDQKVYDSYMNQLTAEQEEKIRELVKKRLEKLSKFWINPQQENLENPQIKGRNFVLINNGDDFVYMLSYMIKRMGGVLDIIENEDFDENNLKEDDIVLLGPGPGDINNQEDPKMKKLLKVATSLQDKGQKMIGICLGHQALCRLNGMEVPRQEEITQGEQKEIELFGEEKTVGYYNSYSPVEKGKRNKNDVVEEGRLMYRQTKNQVSMQFHPESIMSKDGFEILKKSIVSIL